jgi:hypothetical protein
MEVEGAFNGYFPDELIEYTTKFLPLGIARVVLSCNKTLYNTYVKDNESYAHQLCLMSKYAEVRAIKGRVLDEIKKIDYEVRNGEHTFAMSRRKYDNKSTYYKINMNGIISVCNRKNSAVILSKFNIFTKCIVINVMYMFAADWPQHDIGHTYSVMELEFDVLRK